MKARRILLFSSSGFIVLTAKTMSGLSVEMLSSIVSQLAGQGSTLQQGNYSNSSNVGHSRSGLSISSTCPTPIVNEDEVLVGKEEIFTMEELISKRKRNEKATQAQQTFSVGNSTVSPRSRLFLFETE